MSEREIELKVYFPEAVNLILVDLPGVISYVNHDSSGRENIVSEIESLVFKYVRRTDSIILATSPASEEVETSSALRMAHEVDPTGARPIHVLSKNGPDREGCRRQ